MRPHTVDANVMALFQRERITGERTGGVETIETICSNDCIALDNEKLCLQEWVSAAQGSFPLALTDWISDMIVAGKIKYFGLAPNTCRKSLLKLGLPKDDHKWIRLALGCDGRIIITADIDFFDPSKKKAKAEEKLAIRRNGNGKCSKGLRKEFGIDVVDVFAFCAA
jgi:hypothetical protein